MSDITYANDPATFKSAVLDATNPVVVDFWATWCRPCLMVAPEIEALAAERKGTIDVVKVDVDANPEVAGKYGIMSIPTIGLFNNGELVATSIGAKPRSAIEADLGIPKIVSDVN